MVDFSELKKFFLFNLIGSLIISALVAVAVVLFSEFNEITSKVFLTLFMVILHSLISLAFIWDDEKEDIFERLAFFINVLFLLIVVSFITSIFGIWKIIPGDTVWNLYQTYFVLAFASLHGDILSKALNKEDYLDMIVYVNYLFMAAVVFMLQAVIYLESSSNFLSETFFRILGAAGIVDGTLSILAIIFYKLYMNKHPKTENPLQGNFFQGHVVKSEKKKGLSVWVWVLIIYLVLQIGFFLLRWII